MRLEVWAPVSALSPLSETLAEILSLRRHTSRLQLARLHRLDISLFPCALHHWLTAAILRNCDALHQRKQVPNTGVSAWTIRSLPSSWNSKAYSEPEIMV